MRDARTNILRLLLVAFVAAGVYIAVVTVSELNLAMEAMEWPTTQGVIVKSVVHGGGKRARHELLYAYSVDGRQYQGHRATFRDGLTRYRTSERAQLYPEGRSVQVHYAPARPSLSVLETGIHWPGVLFGAVGALAAIVVGVGGLYFTVR